MSYPDIRAVIIALENVIQDKLANSKIVRLEKLGNFYPSFSSEGAETEEKYHSSLIRSAKVNYRPGIDVRDMIATLKFEKAK